MKQIEKIEVGMKDVLNDFVQGDFIRKLKENEELFYDFENSHIYLKEINNLHRPVKKLLNDLLEVNCKGGGISNKIESQKNQMQEKLSYFDLHYDILQIIFNDSNSYLSEKKYK